MSNQEHWYLPGTTIVLPTYHCQASNMWQMTWDTWYLTHDTYNLTHNTFFLLCLCFNLHLLRDSMSHVCGIFKEHIMKYLCHWVFLSATHAESAGSFTKFLVVRTTKNYNTFTIISLKDVITYLQKLHHARNLKLFFFLLALLAENFK